MGDFYLAKGDLLPELTLTCRDADGVIVPLTGATVSFVMRRRASTVVKVDAEADIVNASLGQVRYAWELGDTDEAGAWEGRIIALFPGALPMSFPNDEHISIMISGA